jgi:hypothetical protein
VAVGGVLLVVFGLLPVVGRVVAAIPYPVLGGAGIVLFGSVAASGVKTLSQVAFEGRRRRLGSTRWHQSVIPQWTPPRRAWGRGRTRVRAIRFRRARRRRHDRGGRQNR